MANYLIDPKPKMQGVIDPKPKMQKIFGETVAYLENVTITKGEPMGLLLTITYPETINFTRPRT